MNKSSDWRQLGTVVNGIIEQLQERRESRLRFEAHSLKPAGGASRLTAQPPARIRNATVPMQLELPFAIGRAAPLGTGVRQGQEVFS